ncbi:hypothetical protein COB72_06685 [bacterium]|nr:MAG: hypothetical protein COB72_06685 [bacterium]
MDFSTGRDALDNNLNIMPKKYCCGLKRKLLVWLLLVAMVPLMLMSVLSYRTAKNSLQKASTDSLSARVHDNAAFIENWFRYRVLDLESQAMSQNSTAFMLELHESFTSSGENLKDYVKTYQWNRIVHDRSEDLKNFQRMYGYYDVFLINMDGDILYTNSREDDLGRNLTTGPLSHTKFAQAFRATAETGQSRFSDLERHDPSQSKIAGFLTTIIFNEDGDKIGVFALQLSPEQIQLTMRGTDQAEQTETTYIIGMNSTHDKVTLRTSSENNLNAFDQVVDNPQTRLWLTNTRDTTDLMDGERASLYSTATHGEVIGIHHSLDIAGAQWGIIAEIPTDVAFAASNKLWRMMAGIFTVTCVLVLLIASSITRRIVEPIIRLSQFAQLVSEGDLDQACPVTTGDEIGGLTESFNSMVVNLRKLFANLQFQKYALDQHAIVTITDIKGNITYANDKFVELSGYSREELLGKNHRLIQSDEHSPEFFRNMWKTIASKKVWSGEIKNIAKDGKHYWVHSTIVPFLDEAGRITHYVAIRTDISVSKNSETMLQEAHDSLMEQRNELVQMTQELELAREEAVEGSQAKSEFLANMSHEIRTPMTAILGFTGIIAENVTSPINIDAINTVQKNGEYLLNIINDILDLSKIEAGKSTIEQIEFHPYSVIREAVTLVDLRACNKGLTIELVIDGALPETISSDPTRLRQILINLLGNSIKFTEKGLVILRVSTLHEDGEDYLQFDVIDQGLGMTPKQTEKLFQPFVQSDGSTTRKYGGTGLGLTISKHFTEMLGGRLTLEASELHVGSHFRFTIRTGSLIDVKMLDDPAASLESKAGVESESNIDLNGYRLLLVEDGVDNQKLITFILKKVGAQITIAENGLIGFDMAIDAKENGEAFDCILMDMQMPVMSGYEATAALREEGYTGAIIALTANAMEGDRTKCIESGCDAFATKPINRVELINQILQTTSSRRRAA